MKKVIFTFLTAVSMLGVSAQHCSTATSTCSPGPSAGGNPTLTPVSDSLPCIVRGTNVDQFINFDLGSGAFVVGGSTVNIDSVRIDTIILPSGLCWKTNAADNMFRKASNPTGCIEVTGNTSAAAGQYRLGIVVSAFTSLGPLLYLHTDGPPLNLRYYVRVVCEPASACPAIDSAGGVANAYIAYATCPAGINEVQQNVSSLNVTPNPITATAHVTFQAEKAAEYSVKVLNVVGAEVYNRTISVSVGSNSFEIERGNLPSGVYFLNLSSENGQVTKRISVE